MKNILIVTTSFPDLTFQNGQEAAGIFVYDFATELQRYAKVTVVAPSKQQRIEKLHNMTIVRYEVPLLPLSLLRFSNPFHWKYIFNTLKSGQNAVLKTAQKQQPDHIFALWALPSGYWAKTAGTKFNIPYSIWALGSDIWTLSHIPIVKNFLKIVLRSSRHLFADGYQLADDVRTLCGLKCSFLPSTRNLPILQDKKLSISPPYTLAYLGRWHPHKGIDLLMESLHFITEEDWKKIAAIQICGGGNLEPIVRNQCEKLQKKGRPVRMRGYLSRKEASELLATTDFLMLPSRIESIPIIFSDALKAYCPIISMPVGDLPRLINQYRVGILADGVTSDDYAKAISNALTLSPFDFVNHIKKALTQFNLDHIVQNFLEKIDDEHP